VPDIGDFRNVPVIEVLVKPGDAVKSDKAAMEVPSPAAGFVQSVAVSVGDVVGGLDSLNAHDPARTDS
jgi:pyruvate/2-oxoglutarate dehydrogenase complex dihydrolipoamide acyltransferase (E2) component